MATEVRVRLYPQQDDFVADPRRYTAFIGGRNSGKTYSGSVKALELASRLGCVAAPELPDAGARRQASIPGNGSTNRASRTPQDAGQRAIPRWNAEIIFVTLESESRVRGPNYAWGWADEVEYVTDRKIWRAFKGAVRDGDTPQLFVTSTPKGRRLVWDEWVIGATAHHALYKATTYDNPFIDADDYVAGLGYDGVFYDQEITAEFVTFEGLVYPKFDRTTQVRHIDCALWATILALDVGTRNPTALLTIRHAGDRIHVEREIYRRGMSSDDIADVAESEWRRSAPLALVIDPSAAGISGSLQQRGLRVRPAKNDVVAGIKRMTSVLKDITVDPSCVNTIAEFESYAYPEEGKSIATDAPVKANDHAMDSLRYAVMELSRARLPVRQLVRRQPDPAHRDGPQVRGRLCLPLLPRRRRCRKPAARLPHPGRTQGSPGPPGAPDPGQPEPVHERGRIHRPQRHGDGDAGLRRRREGAVAGGLPVELWPLRPDWLTRRVDPFGKRTLDWDYRVPGEDARTISPDDLIIIPYRHDERQERPGVSRCRSRPARSGSIRAHRIPEGVPR
jgi:hypothetical protein